MLKVLLIIALLFPACAHALEEDSNKAVILAYHRIDEPHHIESSLSFEQFSDHIKEIQQGEYNVLPLNEIVSALTINGKLPPNTIAITFEGSYRSIFKDAIPLLIDNNLPFTIFIASESTKILNHLDWKTLKKISKYEGADFGILPAQYKHITDLPEAEVTRLINRSRSDFREHMGFETKFFSYPYGEISPKLEDIVKTQGFKAAFGLHSGPAHKSTNILTLPRFTMTESFADIDRFRMITSTLPIPVEEIEPQNWRTSNTLNQIGFTVSQSLEKNLQSLSCHISGQEKPTMEILGNRVEIIPAEPISDERTRLNCTMPAHNEDQQHWRWLGMLFH